MPVSLHALRIAGAALALFAGACGDPPGPTLDLVAHALAEAERGAWSASDGVAVDAVELDGMRRCCLVLQPGARVELPPVGEAAGAELRFVWAPVPDRARGGEPARGGSVLRVTALAGPGSNGSTGASGAARRLAEVVLPPDGPPAEAWLSVSASVPELGGGSVALAFELEPDAGGGGGVPVAIGDVGWLPAGRGDGRERAKNVLLVSLDTLRADHLPFHGHGVDTAPFLTQLVGRMVTYERAFTPSTWTLPAHGSVFTGLWPSQHGAISQGGDLTGRPLPEEALTLAEVLRRNGWATIGIVSGPMLARHFGVAQGFDEYSVRLRRADDVNARAFDALDRVGDRPFFLFLNYFDPHLPLDPPGYGDADHALFDALGIDVATFQWLRMKAAGLRHLPLEVREALLARYDAEIRYLDGALERLFAGLEERGLLDDTVVCLFGDHGESFGERTQYGHGGPFLQSQAHVPLLYLDPDRPGSGRVVTRPVSTVEVPTWIARDVGLADPPDAFRVGRRPIYGERFSRTGSNRMYFDGRYKYLVTLSVANGELVRHEQVFDLERDPAERIDLARHDPKIAERLRAEFQAFLATAGVADEDQRSAEPTEATTDEERALRDELRAMGYVE